MTNPSSLCVMQVVLSLNPGGTERLVIEIVKTLRRRVTSTVCCLDEKVNRNPADGRICLITNIGPPQSI